MRTQLIIILIIVKNLIININLFNLNKMLKFLWKKRNNNNFILILVKKHLWKELNKITVIIKILIKIINLFKMMNYKLHKQKLFYLNILLTL